MQMIALRWGEVIESYLEAHEVDVLVEVLRVALEVSQAKFHLLFLGLETGRDQPVNAQRLPFGQSESHSL